jgi:hypothetical protein
MTRLARTANPESKIHPRGMRFLKMSNKIGVNKNNTQTISGGMLVPNNPNANRKWTKSVNNWKKKRLKTEKRRMLDITYLPRRNPFLEGH